MKYSQRIARVEKVVAPRIRALAERRERSVQVEDKLQAAWAYMYATMSEEHAQIVVDAYASGMQFVQHPDYNAPEAVLLRRCLSALSERRHWPYNEIAPGVAFAMPPAVAEVYLRDGPLPLHECEDCGYHLPHGYFDACPLCGGRIGYEAYFKRRKAAQA